MPSEPRKTGSWRLSCALLSCKDSRPSCSRKVCGRRRDVFLQCSNGTVSEVSGSCFSIASSSVSVSPCKVQLVLCVWCSLSSFLCSNGQQLWRAIGIISVVLLGSASVSPLRCYPGQTPRHPQANLVHSVQARPATLLLRLWACLCGGGEEQ